MQKLGTYITTLMFSVFMFGGLTLAMPLPTQRAVLAQETEMAETTVEAESSVSPRQRVKFDEQRAQRIKKACDKITTRLQDVSSRIDEAKDKRANLYQNLVRVLNQFADKLDEAGIDTTKLRADIATLESMAEEVVQAWSEYRDAVKNLGASANCSEDPRAFHDLLELARDKFHIAKEKAHNVKNFVKTVIKEDLSKIREELVAKKQEQKSNSDEDDTEGNSQENEESQETQTQQPQN